MAGSGMYHGTKTEELPFYSTPVFKIQFIMKTGTITAPRLEVVLVQHQAHCYSATVFKLHSIHVSKQT